MKTLWLPPANAPFVEALDTIAATQGRWAIVGGFAVWVHLGGAHRVTLEGLALDQIPPWLAIATGNTLTESGAAPLLSGALIAVISLVGAAAAGASHRLREAVGLRPALVLLASIEAAILLGMAVMVSPWLLPLLALRSTQAAAGTVLVSAATAPVLPRNHRATFLSLGSLAGRLTYGSTLVLMGFIADFDTVLRASAAIGVGSVGVLIASHFLLTSESRAPLEAAPNKHATSQTVQRGNDA